MNAPSVLEDLIAIPAPLWSEFWGVTAGCEGGLARYYQQRVTGISPFHEERLSGYDWCKRIQNSRYLVTCGTTLPKALAWRQQIYALYQPQ